MAITFPNNPSSGDTHTTSNGLQYTYDGEKWTSIGTNSAGTWTRTGTTVSLTTATDDLNVDSGTLFVDASTNIVDIGTNIKLKADDGGAYFAGKVGIGIASPNNTGINKGTLDIAGSDGGELILSDGGTAKASIRNDTNDTDILQISADAALGQIKFLSGGFNERMRIDNSGRVGIGTTSPSHGLLTLSQSASSAFNALVIQQGNTGSAATDGLHIGIDGAVDAYITHKENRALAFGTGNTERMRIDTSGNLIVGVETLSGQIDKQVMLFSAGGGQIAFARQDSEVGTQNNIGELTFFGNDGGSYQRCARIAVEADGSHANNDKPSRIVFETTGDNQSSSTERMRIDSLGNLNFTQEAASNYPEQKLKWSNDSTTANGFYLSQDTTRNGRVWHEQGLDILFGTSNTERMRIDNAGRVLIGRTSSNANADVDDLQIGNNDSATKTGITLGSTDQSGIAFADAGDARAGLIEYTHSIDALRFYTNGATNERLRIDSSGLVNITGGIQVTENVTPTSGNGVEIFKSSSTVGLVQAYNRDSSAWMDLVLRGNTQQFYANGSELMRVDSTGFMVGRTVYGNLSTNGHFFSPSGWAHHSANNDAPLYLNRNVSDGALIFFYQAGTNEGNISVNGNTVALNGAHLSRWSQLPGGAARTEILRGSVLSNLDEMCEWGEENNEQLNRMKVSDVEGDKNVSGVFQAWDDDDDTYTNDFYCAMTGDFVIRIAEGTTVARGDLLMSAGDGTAKPQDDDIVRSKTIAKVTSTTVSETYADNSYCVPCVLMAC